MKKDAVIGYKILAVGSDTEVFLKDNQGNPVPVVGLLGGTKDKPRAVISKGFAVQEDNVMAEFNIPPATNAVTFSKNIQTMVDYLSNDFKKRGLFLDIVPSRHFKPEQLANPQAQTIGCSSDFCVWTESENEIDMTSPLLKTMRTAGGHIHISFQHNGKKPNITTIEPFVAALDITLGVGSMFLDTDTERRKLYGKAGAFRYKEEYGGVEYRVLSNFWIRSPEISKWVFNMVHFSAKLATKWLVTDKNWRGFRPYVHAAINEGDMNSAKQLIESFAVPLPPKVA